MLKKSSGILKKKAILHERENAGLSKSLKQKDKELEQKDKDLNLERSLWNSRKPDWEAGINTDLHRIEMFDGIISDESSLHCDFVQYGRVSIYFEAGKGVHDGLWSDAAVLRRRRRIQSI